VPSGKLALWIIGLSAVTFLGIEHYKQMKSGG